MKRRLVYRDGGSDKFWEVECVGASYRVTFGRTGTAGQTQTKTFASEREALAAAEKVTAEKLRKGYVDDTSGSASPGAPAPQAASPAPEKPSPSMVHAKDLTIGRDERETFSGDPFVNGWIDVQGSLTCDGDLSCLGITLHPGAELRCRRLIANVLDFDNASGATKLYADGIEARVVRLLQVVASLGIGQPLAGLPAEGKVEADYIQHNAGDLSPSWDYEKGTSSSADQWTRPMPRRTVSGAAEVEVGPHTSVRRSTLRRSRSLNVRGAPLTGSRTVSPVRNCESVD